MTGVPALSDDVLDTAAQVEAILFVAEEPLKVEELRMKKLLMAVTHSCYRGERR